MKGIAAFGFDENYQDSLKLAKCFKRHLYLFKTHYCRSSWCCHGRSQRITGCL
jgi:hypothetical protein